MKRRVRARITAGAALFAALAISGVGIANALDTAGAPNGGTATVTPQVARAGATVVVTGSAWPPNTTVEAVLCGNLALNGASDCDETGAGTTTTTPKGVFDMNVKVVKPPKPCPCVIQVESLGSSTPTIVPFDVLGAPSAAPKESTATSDVSTDARIVGSGPWTSWLGGSANRTLILKVTNTGTSPLINPSLTLTVGKGANPSTYLSQPMLGTIQAGQTVEFHQPFTIRGPAFGQYHVEGIFTGLDKATQFTASTSVYPWILFVVGWLLLQIPLLGLYKRRSVIDDADEDPIEDSRPVPTLDETFGFPTAAPAVLAVGAATAYHDEDPLYSPSPTTALAGAALVGAHAVPGPGGAQYAPAVYAPPAPSYVEPPAPVYAPQPTYAAGAAYGSAAAYGLVTTAATRPAVYRSGNVVGVDQLRWLLMPGQPYAMNTVAPRIVVGGVIPSYQPELPPPPPTNAQAAYLPPPNGMTAELPPPAAEYYSEPPAPQYYSEPPAPQYYSDPPPPQYPTEYPQY